MRHARLFCALITLAVGAPLVGCGDDTTAEKGAEEQALSADGKADSFFRPTEHGALTFGIDARATIEDGASFHAWTFTLTAKADVSLKTDVSKNLDTVMYLYRRDAGSTASWGRYIKKNDDADKGVVWSRIADDLVAGEYRVIVKPYKTALSGTFTLVSSCSGPGCAVVADCKADERPGLPAETDFTVGCAAALRALASDAVVSSDSTSVLVKDRCKVDTAVRAGIDAYIGYWDDVYSWDDFAADYFDGEEPELNVDTTRLGKATLVSLDAGGDEDGLTIVFAADGKALMAYQHNQSPDQRWFCAGGANDAKTEWPTEDCGSSYLWYVPHAAKDETQTTTRGDKAALTKDARVDVAFAIKTFYGERSLADSAEVALDLTQWGDGATITLTDDDGTVEYITASGYEPTITFRTEDGVTTMPCTEAP